MRNLENRGSRLRLVASAALLCCAATGALASSHREAPFITTMPKVDGTDFYMFKSYEPGRGGFVTLIANYLPLQDAYGGPNFFSLDPDALYEIHVDNNGDGKEDLTFQFRFKNTLNNIALNVGGKQVAIPLIQAGGVAAGDSTKLNLNETYTVNVVRGDRRTGTVAAVSNANGGTTFVKPVDFIGLKTFVSADAYNAYAAQYIHTINIPGCGTPGRMFVGQRKDPFVVALGRTFDLINLNPLGGTNVNVNDLADKNVTALEMEVPVSCLTSGDDVIGAWTTASVRQGRLIVPNPASGNTNAQKAGGAWTQVSRLGMPLVNEVVIGVKDKDKFNNSKPVNDGQFIDYVTNPTLPALIEILFPAAKAPTNFPRQDLVNTFLTGLKGVNQPKNVVASEMLRLNTAVPATAKGLQNNLGVLAGDNAGFPNGRRPGDDVVDSALRVVMGVLCTLNNVAVFGCVPVDAPAGTAPLTDGASVDDSFFDNAFPYLKTPIPGSPT
jgi:Domain of unknown function (DUF4331)